VPWRKAYVPLYNKEKHFRCISPTRRVDTFVTNSGMMGFLAELITGCAKLGVGIVKGFRLFGVG
jgi:hypothetical protein